MKIFANLKANHTKESFEEYLQILSKGDFTHEIAIFPPFTAMTQNFPCKFTQGAQDFYPAQNGSFTGEICKEQLEELQIKSVLIGHSERRHILHEKKELIKAKFDFAKKQNWQIVFCVGESLEQRQNNQLQKLLHEQLLDIDLAYENLIIAYEPVWAIGTGVVAKSEDIDETLNFLRSFCPSPLLYGGSVKVENVASICALSSCDGVLVGTASYKAHEFIKLIEAVK